MSTKSNTAKSDQELDQEIEQLIEEDVSKIVDPDYVPYPVNPDNPFVEEIKKAGQ